MLLKYKSKMSKIPSSLKLLIIFPVLMNQVGYIINTIRLNYQTQIVKSWITHVHVTNSSQLALPNNVL